MAGTNTIADAEQRLADLRQQRNELREQAIAGATINPKDLANLNDEIAVARLEVGAARLREERATEQERLRRIDDLIASFLDDEIAEQITEIAKAERAAVKALIKLHAAERAYSERASAATVELRRLGAPDDVGLPSPSMGGSVTVRGAHFYFRPDQARQVVLGAVVRALSEVRDHASGLSASAGGMTYNRDGTYTSVVDRLVEAVRVAAKADG